MPVRVDAELGDPVPGSSDVMDIVPPLPGVEPAMMAVASMTTVFSEAVEQLVRRGPLQARISDIFDCWMCAQVEPMEGLETALEDIFGRRGTPVPTEMPHVLTDRYAEGQHAAEQWRSFAAKCSPSSDIDLPGVVAAIREVLEPVFGLD